MNVGVIGASGYAGGELLRLLANHPQFHLFYIGAHTNAGEVISSLHPQLTHFVGQKFSPLDIDQINLCDLVFIALPHGQSSTLVPKINPKVKIVDLGADYRLSSKQAWEKYYEGDHAGKWVYGLPELVAHDQIAQASRVANPGCYASAIALSIAPILELVISEDIVAVAASGSTGAGRGAKVHLLGSEVMNNLTSYKFGGSHQHTPEIEEVLKGLSSKEIKVSFTPVLAPMPRGILATVTAKLRERISQTQIKEVYEKFYSESIFINLLPPDQMPMTSAVIGSNNVMMQVAVDTHVDRVIISTAIDNLGKGAAGQAIQNANLMCNLAEDTGLKMIGVR